MRPWALVGKRHFVASKHCRQLVHHLRHRTVQKREHGHVVGNLLHGALLHLPLCNNSASIHRSCGAPNRSFCPLLSSTTRRESTHGLIKLFFHNLGQHLCLLLQFHGPLLLLSLLFPLLILRIMLLQQLLRFLDLLLFPRRFLRDGLEDEDEEELLFLVEPRPRFCHPESLRPPDRLRRAQLPPIRGFCR